LGSREKINAVTLQKNHAGIVLGTGVTEPDASFNDFNDLRTLLGKLGSPK